MDIAEVLQSTDNALIIARRDDLIAFATTYAERVIASQAKPAASEPERPMPQPEAIKFMGKSRQAFYKWRKKGIIKPYQIGGRIYYKPSELLEALKQLG